MLSAFLGTHNARLGPATTATGRALREVEVWWIVIVVVVVVWMVWIVAGSFGAPPQGGSPIQGCQGCDSLLDWWSGLTAAQKALKLAWFTTRGAHCRLSWPH